MNNIIYLVGFVVVVVAILGYLGLRMERQHSHERRASMMHTSRMVGGVGGCVCGRHGWGDVRGGGDHDGKGRTDGHGGGANCEDGDQ